MSNTALQYQLSALTGMLNHGKRHVALARDGESRTLEANYELDVQIRSGDYFVTLATILDDLSRTVDDYVVRSKLEDMISDLIYLQDSYTIAKKKPRVNV